MGMMHVGPKALIDSMKQSSKPIDMPAPVDHSSLMARIAELEARAPKIVEVIKHVPVELKVIEEKIVEKIIEKPVERIVEVIKHVPFEVKVIEEKLVEVLKEVPVIEEKIIEKLVHITPIWLYGVVAIETLVIIGLLVAKL